MTTLTRTRRVAPVLFAGVLTTLPLAMPSPATADSAGPPSLRPEPVGAPVAAALAPTYRVVPGTRLQAKPPPWVLPVAGYHLTGRFGAASSLWASAHTGLDFAAPEGAEIRSVAPGVVTETSSDGAYGNKTVLRLEDGTVLWFCHQSVFGVRPGQRVAAGEPIGQVGSTGNVTGPHLHLEVRPGDGDPVDPEDWLAAHDLRP